MTSGPSCTCTMCGNAVDETLLGGACPRCLLGDVMSGAKESKATDFEGHELLGEIARGGMGVVYRARQLEPERVVALKTLRSASLDSPEATARFKHEAAVMVALDHPAILPVYRCGEAFGIPFFTMKLVEGGTLAERISRYLGKWRGIAELMARVCDGVRHAHERGVLHRDLKPGNILFDAAGRAYVSDFGIAKLADSQHAGLTLTLSMIGTPHYLAPEVAAGSVKEASVSSDVWSLGIILYELLTGEKPFKGETVTQVLRALELDDAIPPRKLRADVPRDLEVITLKALSRDPARRYESAHAFAEDLRAWLEDRPITARAVPAHERAWLWARRNPRLAGTAALLVLSVIAAVASLVWGYVRVKQENVRVLASQENERARLRESLINQARASREAHEMGWRAAGLKALREAYAIRPGDAVRDEAIAHLAGFDLEMGGRRFKSTVYPSRSLEFYAQVWTRQSYDIIVCRMKDGAELFRLPWIPNIGTIRVEFDPRGRWMAISVGDQGTRVYSMDDHRELARWPGATLQRVSEDGEFLPVEEPGRWVLRRTADWSVAEEIRRGMLGRVSTGFQSQPQPEPGSPQLFVTRCERGLDVLDWRTREKLRHVEFVTPPVSFSWLGDFLVGSCANDVTHVFDLRRERSVVLPQISSNGRVFLNSNSVFMLTSAPGGYGDSATQLWHLPTGARLAKGHAISVLQLGPDDRRFVGTHASHFREGTVVHPACVRLLPDRQMTAAVKTNEKSTELSPDGKRLVIRDANKVAVHDMGTGRLLALQEQPDLVYSSFSHDGRELWLAHAKGIKVLKLTRQDSMLALLPERDVPLPEAGTVLQAVLNPGGAGVFVKLQGGAIYEWRRDNDQWRPWNGPSLARGGMITQSHDGRWFTGTAGPMPAISPASAPSEVRLLPSKGRGVGRATFSPDSKRLVVVYTTFQWNVFEAPDWHHVASSSNPSDINQTNASDACSKAAWSPDSSWFAVVNNGAEIHVVEAGTWRTMARLHGPLEAPVSCINVTADASSLVVQRRNGAVEIWDLRKLEEEMRALGMDLHLPPAITPPPSPPDLAGPFDELVLPPLVWKKATSAK